MRKMICLFLAAVMTLSLLCTFAVTAQAEGGKIHDGRWLNANLEGNVTDETPAELKDDFYLYVNKAWILGAQIPDGEASASASGEIGKQVYDLLLSLAKDDSLTGHDAELVHKFYALMDMDYRNEQGVKPLMTCMEAIAKIDSLDTLMAYLCSEDNLRGINAGPFIINVWPDDRDTSVYLTQIDPQTLFLGIPEEYTQRTAEGDEIYAALQKCVLYLLPRVGFSEQEAQETLDRAMAWETLLASRIQDDPASGEEIQYYYTPEELKELAGSFPMMDILAISGFESGRSYQVNNPAFVAALKDLYTEENVPLIRDWLRVTLANDAISYLDQEAQQAGMAGTTEKLGIRGEINEDYVALVQISQLLPVPLDNLYIRAVRDEKKKADITALVEEILAGYRSMLENVDWLGAETRAAAVDKLDNMHTNLVYPEQTEDWSDLDFAGPGEGGSLLEAFYAITDFRSRLKAARMDQPVNRRQWDQIACPADTVNCQYQNTNSFCITDALANGDLYNDSLTYEQKLAGVGFVIAHEISHAFDTQGAKFDKNGVLTDWWTPEDKASFNGRTDRLAAWLNGFIPLEDIHCDGKQLCGEVIADMTSMKCLLTIAAQKSDFDYDTFFRYFAACLREVQTREYCRDMVVNDSHALPYLRVNAILAQYGQFFDFYGIQEGDRMYLAPENRVAVW